MRHADCQQFADDALVLRFERHLVTACPLPFAPRLRPPSRAYFAHARAPLPSLQKPQASHVPLRALFLLKQDANLTSPRISLMPLARAFSELLPHVHCFDTEDPTHVRQLAESYLELVARVPVFTLEYRPDFQLLADLTRAVVEAAAGIEAGAVSSSELRPGVSCP